MRIISQPGLAYKDLPYEKYGLMIVVDESDDREPFYNIQTIEYHRESLLMATYSTYELAEKAMTIVQHAYVNSGELINNHYVPIQHIIRLPKESKLKLEEVYFHED